MRCHFDGYPGFPGRCTHYFLYAPLTVAALSVLPFKQPVLRPVFMDVHPYQRLEFLTHRDVSVFFTFALVYKNLISVPKQVIGSYRQQLIEPQPMTVQCIQQGGMFMPVVFFSEKPLTTCDDCKIRRWYNSTMLLKIDSFTKVYDIVTFQPLISFSNAQFGINSDKSNFK